MEAGIVKAPPRGLKRKNGMCQRIGEGCAKMKPGDAIEIPRASNYIIAVSVLRHYSGKPFHVYKAANGKNYLTLDA